MFAFWIILLFITYYLLLVSDPWPIASFHEYHSSKSLLFFSFIVIYHMQLSLLIISSAKSFVRVRFKLLITPRPMQASAFGGYACAPSHQKLPDSLWPVKDKESLITSRIISALDPFPCFPRPTTVVTLVRACGLRRVSLWLHAPRATTASTRRCFFSLMQACKSWTACPPAMQVHRTKRRPFRRPELEVR